MHYKIQPIWNPDAHTRPWTPSRLWGRGAVALGLLLVAAVALSHAHPRRADAARAPLTRLAVPEAAAPPRVALAEWGGGTPVPPGKGRFRRFFRMTVTAYTPINTRMEGGRYTSTRRDGRAVHGVAVDPDLIPLGSRLWIPGYGYGVADDVGGRIRGHHIDLRLQRGEHMGVWGIRHARVYVLQDP